MGLQLINYIILMLFVKGHLEKYLKFKNIFGAHPQKGDKKLYKMV